MINFNFVIKLINLKLKLFLKLKFDLIFFYILNLHLRFKKISYLQNLNFFKLKTFLFFIYLMDIIQIKKNYFLLIHSIIISYIIFLNRQFYNFHKIFLKIYLNINLLFDYHH